MRMQHRRESYIPQNARKVADKESSAVAHLYETNGNIYAVGFHGRAQKPDWHYRFRTEAQRETRIQEFFEGQRARAVLYADLKAERQSPHTLKPGDILYSSWGYDQTNVDWYQVTALIGSKMVEIREIAARVASNGGPSENVVPEPGQFTGEPMRKRVQGKRNTVRIASYARAYPWDSNPKYQTGANWGH